MSSSLRVVELELLNGMELNRNSLVILPVGSLEFHGRHAPLGTDSIIAEELAKAVASRTLNGFVLPALKYSFSTLHQKYPGTVSTQPETVIALIRDIICCLAGQGIERVLVINGHDGNVPCIDIAAVQARSQYPNCQVATTTWWQLSKEADSLNMLYGEYGGKGHGGAEEVALILALNRGQVDLSYSDSAPIAEIDRKTAAPFLRHDFTLIYQDIAEISGKPFEGVPGEASIEKGRLVFEYLVERITSLLDNLSWIEPLTS